MFKQLHEYRNASIRTDKRWTELLKENNQNLDRVNLLKRQLNEQAEMSRKTIEEYDKKYRELLIKMTRVGF